MYPAFDLHSQQAKILETVPDETSGRTITTRISSDIHNTKLRSSHNRPLLEKEAWTANRSRVHASQTSSTEQVINPKKTKSVIGSARADSVERKREIFEKCIQQYGSKDESELFDLFAKNQEKICSLKKTNKGHHDIFETDLLAQIKRLQKV